MLGAQGVVGTAAAALAAVLAVGGCAAGIASTTDGSGSATGPPSSTSTSTVTAPALALGTAYTSKDGSVTLTVQRVVDVARVVRPYEDAPPQVGGALVKGCVAAGDGTFTWDAWTGADPAGIQFFHFGPVGEDIKPWFPTAASAPVPHGSCATGWVFFELLKGATIARVTYTRGADTASWSAT